MHIVLISFFLIGFLYPILVNNNCVNEINHSFTFEEQMKIFVVIRIAMIKRSPLTNICRHVPEGFLFIKYSLLHLGIIYVAGN